MRLIICLCATALLAVCASQLASADEPVAPATTPAAAEPPAEAKSTPATTAEAQPAATAAEAKPAVAPVKEKDEVTQSSIDRKVAEAKKEYMQVDKDGQTLYCKREPKLGTRLPQYLCLSEAELINRVRSNEDLVDRGRLPKPCSSGACSGS